MAEQVGRVKTKRLVPQGGMAVGDKRKGARYLVTIDGAMIGEVEKQSESSYRSDQTGSPSRWGFRGYSLTWQAIAYWRKGVGPHNQRVTTRYRKRDAVRCLVDAWKAEAAND